MKTPVPSNHPDSQNLKLQRCGPGTRVFKAAQQVCVCGQGSEPPLLENRMSSGARTPHPFLPTTPSHALSVWSERHIYVLALPIQAMSWRRKGGDWSKGKWQILNSH